MKQYETKSLKLFFTWLTIFLLVEITASLFAPILEGANEIITFFHMNHVFISAKMKTGIVSRKGDYGWF